MPEREADEPDGHVTTNLRALGAERIWIVTNAKQWGNRHYRGAIDEICVFNRALTPQEVQTLAGR